MRPGYCMEWASSSTRMVWRPRRSVPRWRRATAQKCGTLSPVAARNLITSILDVTHGMQRRYSYTSGCRQGQFQWTSDRVFSS
ncbi:hypothetical protein OH76DRAFT_1401670 [Lentinus brumalis]|uniref:Uncharacterized protein n=1 Tax=Lentinus brumalis TaxID=2498619 RepID=A0A371DFR5_9APHY|nr:hypothetical protein OH76DRAFT_1401670 [Polyporus brumalis]